MKHTLETIKKALDHHEEMQDAVSFSKLKGEIKGFEKELLDKLVNEKGIVTINDDDSTRDVLIGIKEILGE